MANKNQRKNEQWDKIALEAIAKETDLNEGFPEPQDIFDEQYYDVYRFYPRQDVVESVKFAGSPVAITLQASLLNAMIKYWTFDWIQWRDAFEEGFLDWQGFPKYSEEYGIPGKPYGRDPKHRPKIVEMTSKTSYDFKVVLLFPDRSQPARHFLFSGTYQEISLQIRQFWTQDKMMREKDIGQFVGYPMSQHLRQNPVLAPSISLYLVGGRKWLGDSYYPKKKGRGGLYQINAARVTIFQFDRRFGYDALRKAMGGNQGISWGNYTSRAYLTPKSKNQNPETQDGQPDSRHKSNSQMVSRGGNQKAANDNLKRFLHLSKAILTSDPREGYEPPDKDDPRPNEWRMYPGWVTVSPPSKKLLKRAFKEGDYDRFLNGVTTKLPLYEPEKPEGWDKKFKAALNMTYGL